MVGDDFAHRERSARLHPKPHEALRANDIDVAFGQVNIRKAHCEQAFFGAGRGQAPEAAVRLGHQHQAGQVELAEVQRVAEHHDSRGRRAQVLEMNGVIKRLLGRDLGRGEALIVYLNAVGVVGAHHGLGQRSSVVGGRYVGGEGRGGGGIEHRAQHGVGGQAEEHVVFQPGKRGQAAVGPGHGLARAAAAGRAADVGHAAIQRDGGRAAGHGGSAHVLHRKAVAGGEARPGRAVGRERSADIGLVGDGGQPEILPAHQLGAAAEGARVAAAAGLRHGVVLRHLGQAQGIGPGQRIGLQLADSAHRRINSGGALGQSAGQRLRKCAFGGVLPAVAVLVVVHGSAQRVGVGIEPDHDGAFAHGRLRTELDDRHGGQVRRQRDAHGVEPAPAIKP